MVPRRLSQKSPMPAPIAKCREIDRLVVIKFVSRGFPVSQVCEALSLTEGDEALAEEVLKQWKRSPPLSAEPASSLSGSRPSAVPRLPLDALTSPSMSTAEAADMPDPIATAEKEADKDILHRDGYEAFYGYDSCGSSDGTPTPRASRTPASLQAAAALFSQAVHLPDQDACIKEIDMEEAPGYVIHCMEDEDEDDAAKTCGALTGMSKLFPSDSIVDAESEVKKQQRLNSTRCSEISALLAKGWMPPDSVRGLKDELKRLQAKGAESAAQPTVERVQTWHSTRLPPPGVMNFVRAPIPSRPLLPPPVAALNDPAVRSEATCAAAAAKPAQAAAPAKPKAAGGSFAPRPRGKGKGKGSPAASSDESEQLVQPPPPTHSGKGVGDLAAPPTKDAPALPAKGALAKGGGKGPGPKDASAPKGPPPANGAPPGKGGPPAKGGGKGGPAGALGKAPVGKARTLAAASAKAAGPEGKPIGRRFDWKTLPCDKVEGTVFAKLSAQVSVDVASLRALFEKPKEVEDKEKRKTLPGMNTSEPEVQLLARGRAQNIMIALRKQPLTAAILEGLQQLDFETTALTPEAIDVLTGAVPTPEEAKLLIGHRPSSGKLREVENKTMPLARLERPAAGQRLRLMLFRKTMAGLSEDVHIGLSSIRSAFDAAQNSAAFRAILCHTVRLGSVINFGSSTAEAEDAAGAETAAAGGFGLDALSRLAHFKAPGNSRITLLHVLVAQVCAADPDLPTKLTEEMCNVHEAAKRSLASLADAVSAFTREAEHVSSSANGGGTGSDDPIAARLAKFSEHASSEAGSLAQVLAATREAAQATLAFFAITCTAKDVDAKSLELCGLLSEFASVLEKTKKEIMMNPALASLCHSGTPRKSMPVNSSKPDPPVAEDF